MPIPLPESSSPIVSMQAQNLRSSITRENGEIWYWGGYFYEGYEKLQIINFNLLQEDEGMPDKPVVKLGLGFAHDTVLVEEKEALPI